MKTHETLEPGIKPAVDAQAFPLRVACVDPLGLEQVEFTAHRVGVSDGVSLRVLEWAPPLPEGSPVVFVAGMITVVESWVPVLRELAASRRVLYVETREKSSAEIGRGLMKVSTFLSARWAETSRR